MARGSSALVAGLVSIALVAPPAAAQAYTYHAELFNPIGLLVLAQVYEFTIEASYNELVTATLEWPLPTDAHGNDPVDFDLELRPEFGGCGTFDVTEPCFADRVLCRDHRPGEGLDVAQNRTSVAAMSFGPGRFFARVIVRAAPAAMFSEFDLTIEVGDGQGLDRVSGPDSFYLIDYRGYCSAVRGLDLAP